MMEIHAIQEGSFERRGEPIYSSRPGLWRSSWQPDSGFQFKSCIGAADTLGFTDFLFCLDEIQCNWVNCRGIPAGSMELRSEKESLGSLLYIFPMTFFLSESTCQWEARWPPPQEHTLIYFPIEVQHWTSDKNDDDSNNLFAYFLGAAQPFKK